MVNLLDAAINFRILMVNLHGVAVAGGETLSGFESLAVSFEDPLVESVGTANEVVICIINHKKFAQIETPQ